MTNTAPHSQPSLLARSVENLSTVLGVWHKAMRDRLIYTGVGDVLVPALLLLLVQAFGYRVLQPHAALNISVVQNFAGGVAIALLALTLAMVLMRQSAQVWQVVIGVLWALILGNLASTAALAASDATSLADWVIRRFGLVLAAPLVFLLFRLGWRGLGAFAGLALPALLVALPWLATLGAPEPEADVAFFDPDVEMIYAAQDALLAKQIDQLRPGVPGTPELFAVLGAGYPYEGVFRREVEAVGALLADRFEAQGRVLSLANDDADLETYPLMNRVNLRASLKAIAPLMNPEDIAMVFLTSHGSPGMLSTSFYELVTRDLTASDLNDALRDAAIRNAIVILPACYSGSFADAVATDDRLVLTGADADSVSFGCNDQNEWTEWGRAFFVDALSDTRDFRQAAKMAQASVAKREAAEGLQQSSPLIIEGDAIGRILDRWLAEFD